MMKKLAILFTALLACAIASGQDEIWINPDTTYAAADATAAEIEAVSSIYNASGFELDVDWQWNSIELPPGWSVEFCENNGCFPISADTIFSLNFDETVPVSAIFHPNGILGTGKVIIRLYSASPGIHIEERLIFIATATGPNATVENGADAGITLFPIPVTDELTVVAADANFKGSWTVVDAAGQTVLTRADAPPSGHLDVSTLPPGMYFLIVRTEVGRLVAAKKFSVQ
jgi:hypothetical protein